MNVCKNNSPCVRKNALPAADRYCCTQCSNTDIITNRQMTAAKVGKLFKYCQMWQSVTAKYCRCQTSMPIIYVWI